jgi:hypothetical protein
MPSTVLVLSDGTLHRLSNMLADASRVLPWGSGKAASTNASGDGSGQLSISTNSSDAVTPGGVATAASATSTSPSVTISEICVRADPGQAYYDLSADAASSSTESTQSPLGSDDGSTQSAALDKPSAETRYLRARYGRVHVNREGVEAAYVALTIEPRVSFSQSPVMGPSAESEADYDFNEDSDVRAADGSARAISQWIPQIEDIAAIAVVKDFKALVEFSSPSTSAADPDQSASSGVVIPIGSGFHVRLSARCAFLECVGSGGGATSEKDEIVVEGMDAGWDLAQAGWRFVGAMESSLIVRWFMSWLWWAANMQPTRWWQLSVDAEKLRFILASPSCPAAATAGMEKDSSHAAAAGNTGQAPTTRGIMWTAQQVSATSSCILHGPLSSGIRPLSPPPPRDLMVAPTEVDAAASGRGDPVTRIKTAEAVFEQPHKDMSSDEEGPSHSNAARLDLPSAAIDDPKRLMARTIGDGSWLVAGILTGGRARSVRARRGLPRSKKPAVDEDASQKRGSLEDPKKIWRSMRRTTSSGQLVREDDGPSGPVELPKDFENDGDVDGEEDEDDDYDKVKGWALGTSIRGSFDELCVRFTVNDAGDDEDERGAYTPSRKSHRLQSGLGFNSSDEEDGGSEAEQREDEAAQENSSTSYAIPIRKRKSRHVHPIQTAPLSGLSQQQIPSAGVSSSAKGFGGSLASPAPISAAPEGSPSNLAGILVEIMARPSSRGLVKVRGINWREESTLMCRFTDISLGCGPQLMSTRHAPSSQTLHLQLCDSSVTESRHFGHHGPMAVFTLHGDKPATGGTHDAVDAMAKVWATPSGGFEVELSATDVEAWRELACWAGAAIVR